MVCCARSAWGLIQSGYDYRPRKLWRIMVQHFGQKLFFPLNAFGSKVPRRAGSSTGLVSSDLPNKLIVISKKVPIS